MNMDFHVHGLLSKRKDFNKEFFMNEIHFAKSSGLNGIVLCEHFNAKDFLVIYDFLEKNFAYEGDRYIIEGISLFPAMEVSIKNKGHVILAGERDSIIDIYEILKEFREKDNLIELEALLDQADIFKKGESIAKDELINLSQELGLNIITGSDSHTPIQLGGIYTSLNKECSTIKELKECIVKGDYTIEINSALNFKIFSSKILKRYLLKSETYDKNTEFKI